MKQGQHFLTTINLDEVMNASRQKNNVCQALAQLHTLLSQDISHPHNEGKTLAQQFKDKQATIKQEIKKFSKDTAPSKLY